jgi:hypothetical protein
MPSPRGRWLGADEVPVGKKVQAKDGGALWYDARVYAVSGEGKNITVHIKFDSFKSSHDVWYQYGSTASPPPIRTRLTRLQLRAEQDAHVYGVGPGRDKRGNWLVERVVRMKKKGQKQVCLVEWAGWGVPGRTWEPKENIPKYFIERYSQEQETIKAARRPKPLVAFSPAQVADESSDVRAPPQHTPAPSQHNPPPRPPPPPTPTPHPPTLCPLPTVAPHSTHV